MNVLYSVAVCKSETRSTGFRGWLFSSIPQRERLCRLKVSNHPVRRIIALCTILAILCGFSINVALVFTSSGGRVFAQSISKTPCPTLSPDSLPIVATTPIRATPTVQPNAGSTRAPQPVTLTPSPTSNRTQLAASRVSNYQTRYAWYFMHGLVTDPCPPLLPTPIPSPSPTFADL